MVVFAELDHKIQVRFHHLIEEAETLVAVFDGYNSNHYSQYLEWVVKASGLLTMLFGDSKQGEKYRQIIETEPHREPGFTSSGGSFTPPILRAITIRKKAATMSGIQDNYVNGFYDGLEQQIVANVSADYMAQAEALLGEGIECQYDHVPAAVLCGAVLENNLRRFCEEQDPPIEITKGDGSAKTLGPLIGELEQRKLFNKLAFKNLKAWSDIRNSAAHGRFDDFTRHDVELMLAGVRHFLLEHL